MIVSLRLSTDLDSSINLRHHLTCIHMRMTNSYFRAPVAPWVRHLACWFRVVKTIRFTMQWKHAISPSVILVLQSKLYLKLFDSYARCICES